MPQIVQQGQINLAAEVVPIDWIASRSTGADPPVLLPNLRHPDTPDPAAILGAGVSLSHLSSFRGPAQALNVPDLIVKIIPPATADQWRPV